MKLLEIYTSILKFSGLDADEQGYISSKLDDKRTPLLINGARLVLPTKNNLINFNQDEKIIFHPLTENILRGESDVIKKLKHVINIRLNFTLGVIAQQLLVMVSSPEHHSKLSPEQAEILTIIKDADEKSVHNFISAMVSGIKIKPDNLFVNIYLKRGGTHHGKRFSRVGIVSFPFYDSLKTEKHEKIRVKDKETYKQLFQFIFTSIDDPEEYNFGSNSQVAPYLSALLKTAANIASRLNDIIVMYKDYIDESDKLTFDSDWLEHFDDLNALLPEIRSIPVQYGNDGNINDDNDVLKPIAQAPAAIEQPYQPQPYQPQYQQPIPQQPQYMPQQRPELKVTKRGLDFKSIVQTTPTVAYVPNQLLPQLVQQQYPQQMPQYPQQMPQYPQQMPQYPQQMPQQYPQQMPQYPQQMPQQYLQPPYLPQYPPQQPQYQQPPYLPPR